MSEDVDFKVFSRQIDAAGVTARGSERRIEATAEERVALAALLDLRALDRLVATLDLRRLNSGLIEVRGYLEADVVQQCVVSLAPLPASVADSFKVTYGEIDLGPGQVELNIDYEESDPPEPIQDGAIDLGAIVAEHLSLALDPYPRKADTALEEEYKPHKDEIVDETRPATRKPFADLDKLIK